MTLLLGSLQLGLLYGILAIGVYISFRILNVPDLTTEGSFTFGLATSAMCALSGHFVLGPFDIFRSACRMYNRIFTD